MSTHVYEFKWQVYKPKFRGCANDGTERYSATCFEEAYKKFEKHLQHWRDCAKEEKVQLDWELFSAIRILSDIK